MTATTTRARHNPFAQRILGFPIWAILLALLIPMLIILGLVVVYFYDLIRLIEDLVHYLFAPQSRAPREVIACADSATCRIVQPIVFTAIFLFTILTGFAYTTLLERKLIAWFQQRVGPNRVGPSGFLQPAADGVKLIFKEDIQPVGIYRFVYLLAPILKVVPALIVLAVVPLGPTIEIPWFDGLWYAVPMGLIDVNVGVLWLLAITSLGTYGVILAGWASNNKYAMLGGLRACAQMISYELSLGLSIAVPVMIVGSMSMLDIVEAQRNFFDWFVFQNPLAAAVLMIALLAEVNRAPFDLPEAEQELTAGYMTEYSGMKFALFMMAEYLGMIAVSIIAISLFFGGYHFLFVDTVPILAPLVLVSKLLVLLIGMIWLRATLPRIRYDRLMHFGWKVMLPLALLAVAWSAVSLVIGVEAGADYVTVYGLASGAVFVVALGGGYWLLRRFGEASEAAAVLPETPLAQDPRITGARSPAGRRRHGHFGDRRRHPDGFGGFHPGRAGSDESGRAAAGGEGTMNLWKGLQTTLKHLNRESVTLQYPEEVRPFPERFKGRHHLRRYEDGLEKCIGCSLCAAACPADAIWVEAEENTDEERYSPGERYAKTYEINMLRCIFCGYCEDACPTEAIELGQEHRMSFTDRRDAIYTKEMLIDPVPEGGQDTPQQVEPGSRDRSIPDMPDAD